MKIGLDDPAKNFKKLIDNEENSWKPGFPIPPLYISDLCSVQGDGDGD